MAETLITSSVLILGIILLRFLLRGRISPQLQYGIWGLAAIRLVMPWFYPVLGFMGNMTSPFSVMNAAETVREQAALRPDLKPLIHNLASGQVTHYTAPATMAQRAAGIDWQMIILVLWGAGGILLFIWMLWINFRFSWRLYRSRERYHGDTYGVTELPVYLVENLAVPCFMSYLGDRAIYLPKDMEGDGTRMSHVLVHEDCHARRPFHGTIPCLSRNQSWSLTVRPLPCWFWYSMIYTPLPHWKTWKLSTDLCRRRTGPPVCGMYSLQSRTAARYIPFH